MASSEETTTQGGQVTPCDPRSVYHEVMGLHVNRLFADWVIRSALSYEPLDDDVFVISYPKCGSTWMHHIAYAVLTSGAEQETMGEERWKAMPFLEVSGAEGARAMARPGVIKTHLPFDKQPYSAKAKYVYVARNPYDCCVSFYYHTSRLPTYRFEEGTFDQFFDMFVEGKVDFGDYFDHLLSWYEHRNDPNVLFVTYEELKKDTAGWVLKLGDFFDKEECGDNLRKHPERLERVLSATSLESMKSINAKLMNWTETMQAVPSEVRERYIKSAKENFGDVWEKKGKGEFVRKGVVGDWKNHFKPEQITRMKAWIELKTRGSDVMDLWKDVGLP
ncbi:amine sulfotransferase-like [Amblyomma americanum]